jgi:hypothetical protein
MGRIDIRRGAVLLVAAAGGWAQSVSISPSAVVRGGSGSLLLRLESSPAKAPLALQWEFSFPADVMVDLADIAAGSAAESAQKSLTCKAIDPKKTEGGGDLAFACILAGGQKAVPNGPVAAVRYRVPLEIHRIAGKVRVSNVVGVTRDLKTAELPGAEAAIAIK